VRSH
jgi:hypothetical protein